MSWANLYLDSETVSSVPRGTSTVKHRIYFQVCPKNNFPVLHIYTNIHMGKLKITQLTWIHLVNTCNI